MDDTNLFRKWPRVSAPPDFEERVLAALERRRQALPQARRSKAFGLALAGAAAALLVSFVSLNVLTGPKGGPAGLASADPAGASGGRRVLPITETMDIGGEFQRASSSSRPVYLLEHVSFVSNTLVKY